METIFAKLLYEMEKNHDAVLVTLIAHSGSAPRGAGSQMLVTPQGRAAGSVGGGAVEYRAEERALELLRQKRSETHAFQLHANAQEDIGMRCGGDVTALFQYVPAAHEGWNGLAKAVMACFADKRPATLALRLNGFLAALTGDDGALLAGLALQPGEEAFSLPLPLGERAVIFGGGHIALALAPLLKTVGFRPVVYDDRPEYATAQRFPDAEQVVLGDYDRVSDFLALSPEDYLVIMTNGHSHDFEVQEQVLRGERRYVGVIGSAKKTAAVNARLRERGISEERLREVHTPIGTAIRAVTPAEIAVSIAGEMILVRALHREGLGRAQHSCPMHGE